MSKVKYLTKGDWLFVIVLLGCLIYSFFTSKSSTLLLFFQALATAGCYFILKKDTLLCIPFREDLLCHRV